MSYESNKLWRLNNPEEWKKQRAKNYEIGRKHKRQRRKPWTPQEDALVLCFSGTDRELAAKIERSVQTIQVRRSRLKKKQTQSHQR